MQKGECFTENDTQKSNMAYLNTKKAKKKSYIQNLETQIRFFEAFLREEELQETFENWVAKKVEEKTTKATQEAIEKMNDGKS